MIFALPFLTAAAPLASSFCAIPLELPDGVAVPLAVVPDVLVEKDEWCARDELDCSEVEAGMEVADVEIGTFSAAAGTAVGSAAEVAGVDPAAAAGLSPFASSSAASIAARSSGVIAASIVLVKSTLR